MLSFNLFEIRFKSMIIERSYSYPLTAIIFLKRHKYECMNIHKKHVLEEMTYIKTIECRFNSFLYSLFLSLSLSLSLSLVNSAFSYFHYSKTSTSMKRIALSNWRETHPFLTILENIFNHAFCTTCGFYSEPYRRCVNVCIQTFAFE